MLTYKEDLLNYINSQPDDRPINFSQNNTNDSCGCLMVHYFKDLGYKNFSCGLFTIMDLDTKNGKTVLDKHAAYLIAKCMGSGIKNYKELKDYLTN
jgi:hypothetical protein